MGAAAIISLFAGISNREPINHNIIKYIIHNLCIYM